jgi:hypothetical protein
MVVAWKGKGKRKTGCIGDRIWMCFYIWGINRSVHNFSIFRRLGSIYCIAYLLY